MFIQKLKSYLPNHVINNKHFTELNGLSDEWILSRTGIRERRKASEGENTNSLGIEALKLLEADPPFPLSEIDLIVAGTYTPYDSIHTLAHAAQRYLNLKDIPVVSISTACASFVNAMEIVEGYFALQKARRALVIVADHNTRYSDERDKMSGHLWGDGASALLLSAEKIEQENNWEVLDIISRGGGHLGKADEGVVLRAVDEGFVMNNGRDVFINACQYMESITRDILAKNKLSISDIRFFVPHQANLRITQHVGKALGLEDKQVLSNIQYLGNTGCAGCSIALYEHQKTFQKNDLIAVTVFGGGYAYGALLLRI